ncbi:hypothetical protein EJ04DRAFT_54949 [Polyplosphaeria fusca]|uniref:Uncharacterized protein n=1 Tax=Polyplosphaeria fusca TaxID=682080 RepID=A0A9P4UVK3_9PLEO|nr:hypothetical protein EJ04DRAFT_54949 [Polyplosphaeria fusca]
MRQAGSLCFLLACFTGQYDQFPLLIVAVVKDGEHVVALSILKLYPMQLVSVRASSQRHIVLLLLPCSPAALCPCLWRRFWSSEARPTSWTPSWTGRTSIGLSATGRSGRLGHARVP